MIDKTLAHYEISGLLGKGGMGEVYRATDRKLAREVAVKVLPEEFTEDAERRERFEREARAVAALSHPNILSIFDFGVEDGVTYAVMELLEGETLRERVAAGPIPVRKALEYARQIADGLGAAHVKGIIHRDLKPENVFLCGDGRVKILDFGLARMTALAGLGADTRSPTLAEATAAGAVLGTVGYMSPEQVRGEPADARSDIFALGLVLYEMLAGGRAFERETGAEVMTAILREDPPDLAARVHELPPAVNDLVRHCLEKRPEERFQSARDLAFQLDALSGYSTTGAVPPLAAPAPPRSRWKRIAGVVGILALIGTHFAAYRWATSSASAPAPSFRRLTFQRGSLSGARVSPDGQTVIYSASWRGGPLELYSTRIDGPESKALGLPSANLWSISDAGELAIGLDPELTLWSFGRLATVPLLGGAPRELAGTVSGADWTRDGRSLVVTNAFESEGRLESPPGTTIFEAEGRLTYPRVSPDGNSIAVCHNPSFNDTRGRIVVVDWQGNSRPLSPFYPDLRGVDWSPDGSEIWFTAKGHGVSAVLRAVSLDGEERVVYKGVGDVHLRDVTADGKVLLERYGGRWETAGRGSDGAAERDLSIFDWTLIRDVSVDGKTVLLAETGDSTGPNYASYLRATDGSPPIRLGIGMPLSLSPSGGWVLSASSDSRELFLYPTGAGQSRTIAPESVEAFDGAWFLDDERALVSAKSAGEGWRGHLLDIASGQLEAITDEGIDVGLPTPNGQFFTDLTGDVPTLVPLGGEQPWELQGIESDDWIIRWASDNRSVFLWKRLNPYPTHVYRVDTKTGAREVAVVFEPMDLAGTSLPTSFRINADGTAWAFSYPRIFSELHLVEGLQ